MADKKIILVDMDDTICHLVKRCIYHHNTRWAEHPIAYENVVGWDMSKIWHPECTEKDFFGVPGLYEELELFDEHVVEEMYKLHQDYDVNIVTAAWPEAVIGKWVWLQKHMPFIPHANFCVWKKKWLIQGDLLIDDAVHNLVPFAESGRPVIGLPHPWNQEVRDQVRFKYDGWKDMKKLVDSIFEERR